MTATRITSVKGRRIWDSRGRPTVEVEVALAGGQRGRGVAPSGASRGTHEAIELRDGGAALGGFGVDRALDRIADCIAPALLDLDALDQQAVDSRLIALDGTANKSSLGGNAMIATSLAVLDAAARAESVPMWRYLAQDGPVSLPLPQIQIFGGGAHAGRRVDIQDFLIYPVGSQNFDEALVMAAEVYRAAGRLMDERGLLSGVADEGGWWPNFDSNEAVLDALALSIERAGYRNGEVQIALDVAASEFFTDGSYRLALEDRAYSTEAWLEHLYTWIRRYPIIAVEDPVAEGDLAGMQAFTARVGDTVQVVGDDFLVTSGERVRNAVAARACNAVLIKPNQAGTVSEAKQALDIARAAGWGAIVSARSGETEDVAIMHLAVGWNVGQLKVGSFSRSERMAKWNEGLRIESELGRNAKFAGRAALAGAGSMR